jgi:hypothetical protein
MAGNHSAVRRFFGILPAALALLSAPGAGASGSQNQRGRLFLSLPSLPFEFAHTGGPDSEPIPTYKAIQEIQELVEVGNDNDGKISRFAIRSDSAGRATHLEFGPISEPRNVRLLPIGPAMRTCNARGASRLDRKRNCGVELEHARGDTSATRLYSPDLNAETGGSLVLIYLKHYAIFGEHEVKEFWMYIRKDGDVWRLYASAVPRRAMGGLFLHRGSRGIASITACLDSACPAEWSRRPREQNENLPSVWIPAYRRHRVSLD